MANKLRLDLKDAAELQKEMCMSSLKRALDDVEYNGCGVEPLKKKTCLPVSKRHIRGSTSGKKAKVGAHTHCRLQSNKKHFPKAPPKSSLKVVSRTATSLGSDFDHKTDKSTDLALKKKRSKRSADSLPTHTTEESDIKKRKVEQTITETENCQDSAKPATELNTTDATCDTSQRTESPKLVTRFCGIPEYMREGNKECHLQQNYSFRKNVAFARKVVVYSSDGSEYDYDDSDVDNGIGDIDEDDDDLYDDDDLDDDDDDDGYEDVDPDAEIVSQRLNLQIADFFKLHRNREPSVVKSVTKPQSGEVRPTELHETSSFGIGLFHKQPINNTYPEPTPAGGSGAAPAVAAGGFEHDENGNDAEEFDRASPASNNLKHDVPW